MASSSSEPREQDAFLLLSLFVSAIGSRQVGRSCRIMYAGSEPGHCPRKDISKQALHFRTLFRQSRLPFVQGCKNNGAYFSGSAIAQAFNAGSFNTEEVQCRPHSQLVCQDMASDI